MDGRAGGDSSTLSAPAIRTTTIIHGGQIHLLCVFAFYLDECKGPKKGGGEAQMVGDENHVEWRGVCIRDK